VPNSFGGLGLNQSYGHGEPVAMVTLGSMRLTARRLIKLDIEGMEAEAVCGDGCGQ